MRQGLSLLLNWKLDILDNWLATYLLEPTSVYMPLPSCWGSSAIPCIFHRCWRFEFRASRLHSNGSYPLCHPPSPRWCLLPSLGGRVQTHSAAGEAGLVLESKIPDSSLSRTSGFPSGSLKLKLKLKLSICPKAGGGALEILAGRRPL